jgi:hypothetical protein
MLKKMKDLDLLVKSELFTKNDISYPSAEKITNQFGKVEIIKLNKPLQITDKENNLFETYSKFILESKLCDNEVIDGFYGTVGLLANYDRNKFTVYSGATAWACLNLSIFGAGYVKEYNLLNHYEQVGDFVQKAKDVLIVQLEHIKKIKKKLEAKVYTLDKYHQKKGELLHLFVETSPGLIPYLTHATLQDISEDSIYLDQPLSDWRLLSSMTDLISKQGVSSRVTKTLELESLFV